MLRLRLIYFGNIKPFWCVLVFTLLLYYFAQMYFFGCAYITTITNNVMECVSVYNNYLLNLMIASEHEKIRPQRWKKTATPLLSLSCVRVLVQFVHSQPP